jgi:hypothetical protein
MGHRLVDEQQDAACYQTIAEHFLLGSPGPQERPCPYAIGARPCQTRLSEPSEASPSYLKVIWRAQPRATALQRPQGFNAGGWSLVHWSGPQGGAVPVPALNEVAASGPLLLPKSQSGSDEPEADP